MQRDEMLAKVDAAYAARRSGDFSKLSEAVADGAAFSFAGEESLLAAMPGSGGVGVHTAAEQLFNTITLHSLEREDAVAEGNRVAILWRANVAGPSGEPFDTRFFDLWEFDDSGKICCGTQFVDTAKFVTMLK